MDIIYDRSNLSLCKIFDFIYSFLTSPSLLSLYLFLSVSIACWLCCLLLINQHRIFDTYDCLKTWLNTPNCWKFRINKIGHFFHSFFFCNIKRKQNDKKTKENISFNFKQNWIVCCTSKSPHSYQKSIINNLWANGSRCQYKVIQIEFVGEHDAFRVCITLEM